MDKAKVISFLQRKDVVAMGAGVLGLAVGSGGTYLILNKRLMAKYEAIANAEIDQARDRYKVMVKEPLVLPEEPIVNDDELDDPLPLRIFPDDKLKTEIDNFTQNVEKVAESEKNTPEAVRDEVRNIFRDAKSANSHFDYDEEIPKRSPDRPYVITEDEFLANEDGLEQSSLTYYEQDDVLADERDEVVNEADKIVGEENLQRWGHGARDRNMVHVRNEKLGMEWEILRSKGSFQEEVFGIPKDDHLEHSSEPRRFRLNRDD